MKKILEDVKANKAKEAHFDDMYVHFPFFSLFLAFLFTDADDTWFISFIIYIRVDYHFIL